MATFAAVRRLALALPEVEEGTSYGTPGFFVRGKLFVRLREDGETLVVRADPLERDFLIRSRPDLFFVTDHYRGYPWVLVRLKAATQPVLRERIRIAWELRAPKRLRAAEVETRKATRRD